MECVWKYFMPAATLLILLSGIARAETIGPDCSSCQGVLYTLSGIPLGNDLWRITLSLDTTGYNGAGVAIDAVSIKLAAEATEVSLYSAPGAVADWELVEGQLRAHGFGNGAGFDSANWVGTALPGTAISGILSWTFYETIPAPFDPDAPASIKVRYVDGDGNKVGALLSEPIQMQVPEADLIILLGIGLVFVSVLALRFNKS